MYTKTCVHAYTHICTEKSETVLRLISGFHCEVDESHVLLGYYVAGSGNSLLTFQDNQMVLQCCLKKLV